MDSYVEDYGGFAMCLIFNLPGGEGGHSLRVHTEHETRREGKYKEVKTWNFRSLGTSSEKNYISKLVNIINY